MMIILHANLILLCLSGKGHFGLVEQHVNTTTSCIRCHPSDRHGKNVPFVTIFEDVVISRPTYVLSERMCIASLGSLKLLIRRNVLLVSPKVLKQNLTALDIRCPSSLWRREEEFFSEVLSFARNGGQVMSSVILSMRQASFTEAILVRAFLQEGILLNVIPDTCVV